MILTWLSNNLQRILLRVLATGPIPQHVAFVMDGNRRYARTNNKLIQEGHTEGFVALRKMLEICMRLNIRCVSAYAFSIENFKRAPDEVDALMGLIEEKLLEICQHGDLLDEYGVRLNVIGNTQLFPESVQRAVHKAESLSRHNSRAILNLCMPYTSRDEITTAVQSCVQKALEDGPTAEPITEHTIAAALPSTLASTPPLDILIRTSGVARLSDFFLWQCSEDTQIQFSSVYWPDFGLWQFLPMIIEFQRKAWSMQQGESGDIKPIFNLLYHCQNVLQAYRDFIDDQSTLHTMY